MTWRSILAAAALPVLLTSCLSKHPSQGSPIPSVTVTLRDLGSPAPESSLLVPIRLAAQEPGQFTRWKLSNDSQDVIRPVGWLGWYVHLESRTAGGWVQAPISYCATVTPYNDPLLSGGSREVVTLCPIDREILPAGNYRAVMGYTEDLRMEARRANGNAPAPRAAPMMQSKLATAEFEVIGLDIAESDAFVQALSEPDVRSCLDKQSLGNYLEAFS